MKNMVDLGVSVKTAADINQLIRNRKKMDRMHESLLNRIFPGFLTGIVRSEQ